MTLPAARQTYLTGLLMAVLAMMVVWGHFPLKWWAGVELPRSGMLFDWARVYADPIPHALAALRPLNLPQWVFALPTVALSMVLLRRAYLFARHGVIPAGAYSWGGWFLAFPVWSIWFACVYIGVTVALNDGTYDALVALIVASTGMLLAPVLLLLEMVSLRQPDRF